MSGGNTDQLGHLSPEIGIEYHSNINPYPVFFYLKAYLCHTEPLGRSQVDLICTLWVTMGGTFMYVLKPFLLGLGKFG